jgi:hypothetical protein
MTAPMHRGARLVEGSPRARRSHATRRVEAAASLVGGVAATTWPSAANQLRALATRVRRVGLNGRFDPEAAFIERDELAHALLRLADGLERNGQLPTAATTSTSQTLLQKRFAALLAAKASEIRSMRILLAQAVRPRPCRRRKVPEAQLMLPFSETANDR